MINLYIQIVSILVQIQKVMSLRTYKNLLFESHIVR